MLINNPMLIKRSSFFYPFSHMRSSSCGFTLVELLTIIAITMIITVGGVYFGQSFQMRSKQEHRDRLVYAVQNLLETQKDNALL